MSPMPLRPGAVATPAQLAAAKEALKVRAEEVAVVRAAAAKWQAGLAGLLGLVTGSSVLTVGNSIDELATGWNYVAAVLLAISVGLAVWSVVRALRASGGTPKLRLTRGPADFQTTHREARTAAADLGTAITAAIGSLAVFGLVVGLTWFAPQPVDLEPVFVVNGTAGSFCGELEAMVGETLFLTDSDGETMKFLVADLKSVVVDAQCPGT
ncbi:MAG: hypothetical protein GY708_23755 [Actinomycetia bacterium]|nr:hypothetical protein [Actinomycetes bacterium]